MALSDTYLLALEAYRDLQPELAGAGHLIPNLPEPPSLQDVLSNQGSMPPLGVLLGVAEDKLPLILDLKESAHGPLLVVGDGGSGKTAFLQSLACSTDLLHDPGDIQFAAITRFPEEWTRVEALPSSQGIWQVDHPSTVEFLTWVCSRAQDHSGGTQAFLLLLDDLELIAGTGRETRKLLRWLLTSGPEHGVCTVATINSIRALAHKSWLDLFRTIIYGHVKIPALLAELSGDARADLSNLFPGIQFALHQPGEWLRFSIPSL